MPIINRFSRNWNINDEAKANACHSGRTLSAYFNTNRVLIKINGVDAGQQLIKDSMNVDEVTTTQGTQATFTVYGTLSQKPLLGQEVEIAYSTWNNTIFKGQIVDIISNRIGRGSSADSPKLSYDLTCVNYYNLLGRRLVKKEYFNTTVADIIHDLVDTLAPGFAVRSIPPIDGFDVIIDYWYFDNQSVSDAIQNLCDAAYLFWFIRADDPFNRGLKIIDVREKEFTTANVTLSDNNPAWDQLQIEEDWSQVRNKVFVRGAQALNHNDLGNDLTVETQTSTGAASQTFSLIYASVNLVVTVDGAQYYPVIENVDSEIGQKLVINTDNKVVRYAKGASAFGAGKILTFTYDYYLPTLVVAENQDAQTYAFGLEGYDNSGFGIESATQEANPENHYLANAAYGNGLYVAVGENDGVNAYIATSPDGIVWTARANPKNIPLSGVVYGGGLFVAVGFADGADAYIVTSPDGITWTERVNPLNKDLYAITYSSHLGLFVAVGAADGTDAYIVTSSNGTSWTERTNPKNFALLGITSATGLLVAVGTNDTGLGYTYIVTSPNGITWTQRVAPTFLRANGVAFGNGMFVAVGFSDGINGYVITSPDGVVWTRQAFAPNVDLQGVFFQPSYFVITGGPSGSESLLMFGSDGVKWTQIDNPQNTTLLGVCYGAAGFIAVGDAVGGQAYILRMPFGLSIHEAFIQQQSLENIAAAQQVAIANLKQFSYPVIRGQFNTHRTNFYLGDFVTISLSDRPPLNVFIYEKQSQMLGTDRLGYTIFFTDTQRDLYMDLMQAFYKKTNKRDIQKKDAEGQMATIAENF